MRPIGPRTFTGQTTRNAKTGRRLIVRTAVGKWHEPELLNDWVNAGSPYEDIAYRWEPGGRIGFRGHIQGGASGSVAFNIPDAGFFLTMTGDMTCLADIVAGAGFSIARIYLEVSTGDLSITFPAS